VGFDAAHAVDMLKGFIVAFKKVVRFARKLIRRVLVVIFSVVGHASFFYRRRV
jgi:hypothetical protein